MKVLIWQAYGEIELPISAVRALERDHGWDEEKLMQFELGQHRNDPNLIHIIQQISQRDEELLGWLFVVEIPDDVQFEISNYDGYEMIREKHRKWNGEGEVLR